MPNSHSDTESQTTLDRHIIQPEHPASATTTDLEKLPDQKEGKKRESSNVSVHVVDPRYETDNVTIVDWDIDDPENPRNWPRRKKIIATCLVSALTFLTPLSSAMIAPAGTLIAEEFKITDDFVVNMITSVFVLAYAVGPLIIGPLSELFGRKYVGTIANIIYFAFNLGCGFARNTGQLIAFRFLSGIGGSAPFAVSGGVLGDIWTAEERGAANGLYTVGAVLGTGVGPVCGAWIAERTSWRWVFWATSIVDGAFLILFYFLLDESYAPTLLARRAAKIRVERGLPKGDLTLVRSKYENPDWKLGAFVWKSVIRPFELFIQEPIIQVIGAYMTFLYGVVYLVLTTIPNIFLVERGESLGISGLHYIAHIIGAVLAASFSMVTLDPLYRYLKGRKGGIGQPEYRIPVLVLGTIFLPVGMLIIGWTSSANSPWIATDIGFAFVAAGTDLNFQPMTTYIIDAFTLHAASALASVTFLRSIAGFAFPLFAPAMFGKLGYGVGCTILAVIAIVLGCPIPFLLWRYGALLRSKSRYSTAP